MTWAANFSSFEDPKSRMMAIGKNVSASGAITDEKGRVLAHLQTGGMLNPVRHNLSPGAKLFRFGRSGAPPKTVATGGWWVQQKEFEHILGFAQAHDLSIGTAMRFLCLVPPEWSDAGLLIRARVVRDLVAWRGLGDSVVTPAHHGGLVKLPHQNEFASRRVHQLFIPGLADLPPMLPALVVENEYRLDTRESIRGFLYL